MNNSNSSSNGNGNSPLELVQVITTSPSEDHTYSAAKSHDNNASPDEAFESDDERLVQLFLAVLTLTYTTKFKSI